MLPTRLVRVAVVAFAVVAVACGDPTRPKATFANAPSSYALYALTGSPALVPNAFNFLGGATRADAAFLFDIAFDIDASGRAVVYPVRALAGALAGVQKRVGLQVVAGGYEALLEAPLTGYDTLTPKVLAPGGVLAVEIREPSACFSSLFSQVLYGKLVVDSVKPATRRIYGRTVIDPNCGYRSVVPDSVPKS